MHRAQFTILRDNPPTVMILAARTKNGIDIKENLSMLLNICWAKIVKGILPKKNNQKSCRQGQGNEYGQTANQEQQG